MQGNFYIEISKETFSRREQFNWVVKQEYSRGKGMGKFKM